MWHELVLNGIGGRTIYEAKLRLTYAEALDWFAFIRKRGTLNLGMRLEALFAQQAVLTCRAAGNSKATMRDFMPHADPPAEQSFDDMANILMSLGTKTDGE